MAVASWTNSVMAGEMVAVCRSDGVFLILPIVAAAVRLRNQAVSDQATAA